MGTPHGLLVDPDALAAMIASEDANGFARLGVQYRCKYRETVPQWQGLYSSFGGAT